MSGGSSANNSWTILTPEETVAETLKPLAEETEHHEESLTSVSGSGENHPENGAEFAEGRIPVDGHLVLEEKTAELNGDRSTEQHTALSDATPVHTFLEVSDSFVPGKDAFSRSEQLPDSYAHITPSPDEPPASLLSTETLGGVEFTQEEERLAEEGMRHPLNGDGLQQEGEESDLSLRTIDVGKQADSPVATEESDERTEKMGEEGEPEVRRRRSLLAALERIGRTEEEEEGEEEFQLPQRDEDSGFSVNKCILGAVILVGLGTIFFSESDYVTRELKDAELPGKQEWLNPEVPPPPVDADSTELLNKLQAQLQAQKEELNVAKGQAAEGAKERLRWEEVEKENSRLKKEMASLPVLQKENERMKRELESVPALQKELETLRSTVTDLKLSSVTSKAVQAPVKPTTSPSSGQPEDSTQDTTGSTDRQARKPWDEQREKKKDKNDMGEKKEGKEREKSEWMEREKQERKDEGKAEWKKGKFDKEKDKEGKLKRHSDEPKQRKEKDWKKEKTSRGDEGKPWKDREAKKEWIENGKRKELKEEKYWKKAKHEQVKEDQQWSGKEEKEWKVENNQGKKGKEEWKGEKEWKKGKDGFKESGKEKWEKKDWKEKREWKKDNDWKSKNGKDHSKEGKGKGERKQWEESKHHGKERKGKDEGKHWNENKWKSKDDKEWKRKDESKQWEEKEEHWKRGQKENKHNGNWEKDRSSSQKHKEEHKFTSNHGHKEEHLWGDRKPPHTHRRPSLEQPEYWVQQRDRLQHNLKPPQKCDSLETCAQAEGLLPVPFPEFEAVLQTYLAKAEEVGVDEFKREELKKLAAEFFKTGVFVHDQMRFQEFVEDLVDILEDMVEEGGEEEGDSAIEEEMEGFEREVMKKFSVPGAGEKGERSKGEWGKGSERGRG